MIFLFAPDKDPAANPPKPADGEGDQQSYGEIRHHRNRYELNIVRDQCVFGAAVHEVPIVPSANDARNNPHNSAIAPHILTLGPKGEIEES
jgi:hypothetical protein